MCTLRTARRAARHIHFGSCHGRQNNGQTDLKENSSRTQMPVRRKGAQRGGEKADDSRSNSERKKKIGKCCERRAWPKAAIKKTRMRTGERCNAKTQTHEASPRTRRFGAIGAMPLLLEVNNRKSTRSAFGSKTASISQRDTHTARELSRAGDGECVSSLEQMGKSYEIRLYPRSSLSRRFHPCSWRRSASTRRTRLDGRRQQTDFTAFAFHHLAKTMKCRQTRRPRVRSFRSESFICRSNAAVARPDAQVKRFTRRTRCDRGRRNPGDTLSAVIENGSRRIYGLLGGK